MLSSTLTMCMKCALMLLAGLYVVSGQIEEKMGLKSVLDNYQSMGAIQGRPVANMSSPIQVEVTFALIQIVSFDQFNQHLTLTGRTTLQWEDEYLKWENDPEEFSIPADQVWTPDLHIINSIERPIDLHDSAMTVSSSGHVTWVLPQRLTLTCATDPDDTEPSCEIIFSSWSLGKQQLLLEAGQNRVDAGFYVPSNVWELSKTKADVGTRSYPILGAKQFADLTFTFTLKRRPQEEDDAAKIEDGAEAVHATLLSSILASLVVLHMNL